MHTVGYCAHSKGLAYLLAGSMSKKSPQASPKGKAKAPDEASKPYEVQKMKTTTHCFVEEEVLEHKGVCLFKGEFRAPDNKKGTNGEPPGKFSGDGAG